MRPGCRLGLQDMFARHAAAPEESFREVPAGRQGSPQTSASGKQVQDLTEELQSRQSMILELKRQVGQGKEKVGKAEERIAELQEDVDSAKEETIQQRRSADELRRRLEAMESMVGQLQDSMLALKRENQTLRDSMASSEAGVVRTQDQLEVTKAEHKELHRQREMLESEQSGLRHEVAALQKEARVQSAVASDLRSALALAKEEKEELQQRHNRLEQSWRLSSIAPPANRTSTPSTVAPSHQPLHEQFYSTGGVSHTGGHSAGHASHSTTSTSAPFATVPGSDSSSSGSAARNPPPWEEEVPKPAAGMRSAAAGGVHNSSVPAAGAVRSAGSAAAEQRARQAHSTFDLFTGEPRRGPGDNSSAGRLPAADPPASARRRTSADEARAPGSAMHADPSMRPAAGARPAVAVRTAPAPYLPEPAPAAYGERRDNPSSRQPAPTMEPASYTEGRDNLTICQPEQALTAAWEPTPMKQLDEHQLAELAENFQRERSMRDHPQLDERQQADLASWGFSQQEGLRRHERDASFSSVPKLVQSTPR
ncbi:hypothetical protein CYMTET_29194, partial [Cymbomonas tetramitiformis]